MCDFEITYRDIKEGKNILYRCPHKKWDTDNPEGKSFCVFHSKKKDKDTAHFTGEFLKVYKSGIHIFPGFTFPKDFDFKTVAKKNETLAFKDAVFQRSLFLCVTNFSGARFEGEGGTNFIEVEFRGSGGANFSNANFIATSGLDFTNARFNSGVIDFKMANFSGSGAANFSRTTFSGRGNADFTWAKFKSGGGIDFKLSQFTNEGNVDFHFAEFSGRGVNFNGAVFSNRGEVNFSLVQFTAQGSADFGSVKFCPEGVVNFSLAQFSGKGGVNFGKTRFSSPRGANFSLAQFTGRGRDNFSNALFDGEGEVNFSKVRFFGDNGVDFKNTLFANRGGVTFSGAQFAGETRIEFDGRTFGAETTADFRDLLIEHPENVKFIRVDLSRARFLGTDLSSITFDRITWANRLYNKSPLFGRMRIFDELFQEKGRYVRILEHFFHRLKIWGAIKQVLLMIRPNEEYPERGVALLVRDRFTNLLTLVGVAACEREKNHTGVYHLYRQLLKNYRNSGRNHEAGDFFAGKMEMRRRESTETPFTRIALWLYRFFSLYGERPSIALAWLVILFLCSGLVNLSLGIHVKDASAIPSLSALSGEIVTNPDGTAVALLVPEVTSDIPDMIHYGEFPPHIFSTKTFWNDYRAALSVSLAAITGDISDGRYRLAPDRYAPFIISLEIILGLLFSTLFVSALWRKLKINQ